MAYYLGIDGGGSKTTCVVGDENSELARVTAGPSNVTRVGEIRARESLLRSIREACAVAKISTEDVRRACIGVAGAGREEVAGAVKKIVAEVISGEIEVVGDMPVALEAAFGGEPGVIVIAGTGSIAYGRDEHGKIARAGGWGFAISDEGSAHWIGRRAVSDQLRAMDQEGAVDSAEFFRELKTAWNVESLGGIVRTANSNPDFAALFPAIVAAADRGEILAENVLRQAGRELAELASVVVQRLFPPSDDGLLAIPLAMAGGVFRHSERVRECFSDDIQKRDARLKVRLDIVEPVAGALEMARHGAGR